tara:strand:+ start:204 stop:599 length:396 start_codon:yes stop_codon:yes gene_type:complete
VLHVGALLDNHAAQLLPLSICHVAAVPLAAVPLHRTTAAALIVNPALHEKVAVGAELPAAYASGVAEYSTNPFVGAAITSHFSTPPVDMMYPAVNATFCSSVELTAENVRTPPFTKRFPVHVKTSAAPLAA